MKISWLAITVIGLVFCLGSAFAQANVDDSLSLAFIQELNQMRANPAGYIPKILAYQKQLSSFTKNKKVLTKAVDEIKLILKKQTPLPPLTADSSLMKAAHSHMEDGAKHGFVGHIGSDKSDPGIRVARYAKFSALSEAITYGHLSTGLMLAAFLVDEGTPSRGHRIAMLSKDYSLIGTSYGPHPQYNSQIVVVLGSK